MGCRDACSDLFKVYLQKLFWSNLADVRIFYSCVNAKFFICEFFRRSLPRSTVSHKSQKGLMVENAFN